MSLIELVIIVLLALGLLDKSKVLDKSSAVTIPLPIFEVVIDPASFAVVIAPSLISADFTSPSLIEFVVIFVIEPILFPL